MGTQPRREPLGLCVQFGISQLVRALRHRDRLRCTRGLRCEQRVQGAFGRQRRRSGVPVHQQTLAFLRRQNVDIADALTGIDNHRAQQLFQMVGERFDVLGIEQIGGVFDQHRQTAAAFAGEDRQIGTRCTRMHGADVHRHQRQSRQHDRLDREVLVEQHRLEQRRMAEIAIDAQRFQQTFDRQILVRVAVERQRLHLRKKFAEAGIARQVDAQRQGIHEESDQRLDLASRPVGVTDAHDDVFLPRIPRQQRLVGGEESHERGRALLTA